MCGQKYEYPFCALGYYCYDHTPDDAARKLLGEDAVSLRCRDTGSTANCPEDGYNEGYFVEGCKMVKDVAEHEIIDSERELIEGGDGEGMEEEEYSKWLWNWDTWDIVRL